MAKTTTAANQRDRAQDQAPPREAPRGNLPAEGRKVHPLVAFKDYADQRIASLQAALPPHITPNAFMSVALTALQKKPYLLKCTQQSLWNACIQAAQDGLLPDGREGAIAPYGENANGQKKADIATWMPMIEGLRKKARNSGEIKNWEVHVVRARDHFRFALGDEAFIEHEPYFGGEEPGNVIGAYSIATLADGSKSRDVMTVRDIEKIRAKSKAKNGPWSDPTFFPEMCKKTVARRHYKQLPHSAALDRMIERDDREFDLDHRSDEAIDERRTRRLGSVTASFNAFAGGTVIENDADEDWGDGADNAADAADGTHGADDPRDEDDRQDDRRDAGGKRGNTAASKDADRPANTRKNDTAPQQRQQAQQLPADDADADAGTDDADAGEADDTATGADNDTTGADDAGDDDMTDRRWPRGEVPSDPDEYESYVETYLEDCDKSADIKPWFTSDAEKTLRTKCNVGQPLYKALQTKASHRMAALKEQGK